MRLIKRYKNRRLYDTRSSRTITQLDLGRMIREGEEVKVVDSVTGRDITLSVLGRMMVDEVSRMIELQEIEPALPSGTRAHRDFLLGTGKIAKRSFFILDLDRLLSVEELLTATERIGANGDGEGS